MKVLAALSLLLVLLIDNCLCRSGGPPLNSQGATGNPDSRVCEQLWPAGHGSIDGQQQGDGGYTIQTDLPLNQQMNGFDYVAGETYTITINARTGTTFLGYMIQARSIPGNMLIGSFTAGQNQQTLNCDIVGVATMATVAHSNSGRIRFTSVSTQWVAPSDADGMVNIMYTIVEVFSTYYIARSAAAQAAEAPSPPPDVIIPATPPPDSVTPPPLNGSDYPLTFSSPPGCLEPNCTIFVGIMPNEGDPNYLSFYIQGQSDIWAGVGFSQTRSMFSADVLMCYLNSSTGLVEALDTWNVPSPVRLNSVDTVQDTALFSASYENGIITCTFVRTINGTVLRTQEIPLNDSLFVMYGVGVNNSQIRRVHGLGDGIPTLTPQAVNVVTDTNADLVILQTPRAPEDYRLTFRTPPECNISDCTIFVGIDTNNSTNQFLDIYMEGESSAWLAVGFSDTRSMFSADVVACNIDPNTGTIEALDTWNLDAGRGNMVDRTQNVILFNSSVIDGRISCTVAKSIASNNINPDVIEDLNLNNSYWVMYGLRPSNPVSGALQAHNLGPGNPTLSQVRVNAVLDNDTTVVVPPNVLPEGVVDAQLAPGDYRLTLRNPPGCDPSACEVFVGIATNPGDSNYLDFYLEGEAQGWVAVGFSESPNMFDADVLGCNINPNTGVVDVLDTWNPTSPQRGNLLDTTQDTFLFTGTSQNGRIICSFTRLAVGSDLNDPVQDLDLNNEYFIMYGRRPANPAAAALAAHDLGAGNNPIVTGGRINPSEAQGEGLGDQERPRLIRAHGILMLIAWPFMAVTAIFFAAWMRPALPNGQWFQIHRFVMSGSILVGLVGFVLIFIANRNNSPPGLITLGSANPIGTAHYVIGIVVMFMQLINPLIAICRCKPDGRFRWVFNLIHGSFVGMVAELLALTNVGLGLAIFSPNLSRFRDMTVFWVYIAYLAFFIILVFVLFTLFTILAYASGDNEDRGKLVPSLVKPLVGSNDTSSNKPSTRGVELAVVGVNTDPEDEMNKPKIPSKDSPVRWSAFGLFAAVAIPFLIVLIILIAIE